MGRFPSAAFSAGLSFWVSSDCGRIEPILSGNLPPGFDSSTCRSVFGQPIKVNWAYASSQREDTSDNGQEKCSDDTPGNNPQYTTVYVGNLAPEVSSADLHRHFHFLGAGVIEDVRVQHDKGFGFIRYSTHEEAALAIQMGNAQVLFGKPINCSWGSPPGASSGPLPPPVAGFMPGYSAAQLAFYEQQLSMAKMSGMQALLHPRAQHMLKQAGMGLGRMGAVAAAGTSQAVYDAGYQNATTAQQLMYYQ